MKILVTGAAGFIGSKLMLELGKRGDEIIGIDSINDYYDVRLKYGRLAKCGFSQDNASQEGCMTTSTIYSNCRFMLLNITDKAHLDKLFESEKFGQPCRSSRSEIFHNQPIRLS